MLKHTQTHDTRGAVQHMRWVRVWVLGVHQERDHRSQILCKLLIRRWSSIISRRKVLGTFHEIEVSLVENVFTCRMPAWAECLSALMARVAFRP
jgi:hypothetical protein